MCVGFCLTVKTQKRACSQQRLPRVWGLAGEGRARVFFAFPGTDLPSLDRQLVFFAPPPYAVKCFGIRNGDFTLRVFCTSVSFNGRRLNRGAALII